MPNMVLLGVFPLLCKWECGMGVTGWKALLRTFECGLLRTSLAHLRDTSSSKISAVPTCDFTFCLRRLHLGS